VGIVMDSSQALTVVMSDFVTLPSPENKFLKASKRL